MSSLVAERSRDKKRAKEFWDGLNDEQRGDLGDQFVLDTFDWRDWFTSKPSRAFLNEVEALRIHWEIEFS